MSTRDWRRDGGWGRKKVEWSHVCTLQGIIILWDHKLLIVLWKYSCSVRLTETTACLSMKAVKWQKTCSTNNLQKQLCIYGGIYGETVSTSTVSMKCFLTKPDSRGCQICESLVRRVAWRQRGSARKRMSSAKWRKTTKLESRDEKSSDSERTETGSSWEGWEMMQLSHSVSVTGWIFENQYINDR